ncbi:MAG: UvrD-helicase domain-containing protein [Holosporales bacterium]|jgi:ATP-dependent helicase/nuclease subunit A|nr:UvrD-helicase domain-containing protein [Holosporales bacterium]
MIFDKHNATAGPCISSWVSASAGTGKTKLLIDRVLRLLVDGAPFSSILCFTYTNAGACEMQQRLRARLLDLQERPQALFELLQRPPTEAEQARAPTLYLEFLKNVSALQIKTIHSFCKDFLSRNSPLANIIGDVQVLDSAESSKLLQRIQETYLFDFIEYSAHNACDKLDELAKDYNTLSQNMTFEQINDTLLALLTRRYDLAQFLKEYNSDAFLTLLQQKLNHTKKPFLFNETAVQSLARELSKSCENNSTIQSILYRDYEKAFLTTNQKLRKKLDGLSKFDLYSELYTQAEYFFADIQQQKASELIANTQAFIHVADNIFQEYQRQKESRNLYDFEDLIIKSNDIFTRAYDNKTIKSAISFGVQHLFVDEAQDTTPQQWQVILHIVALFFDDGAKCSLFVVGDPKQSIYSFQGAKPWLLQTLAVVFKHLIASIGGEFQEICLNTSYRSAPEILALVDEVFRVTPILGYAPHIPARKTPGFVRCVNLPEGKGGGDAEGGKGADEDKGRKSGKSNEGSDSDDADSTIGATIGATIANIVAELLHTQVYCHSMQRNILPEDILILARRRAHLSLIARELAARNIPCAWQNRECSMWSSVLAFIQFLIDPTDDYNLACFLKGPFLRDRAMSDEELLPLCCNRSDSLWHELLAQATTEQVTSDAFYMTGGTRCMTGDALSYINKYCDDWNNVKTSDDFYSFFYQSLLNVLPYIDMYDETNEFEALMNIITDFLSTNTPNLRTLYALLQSKSSAGVKDSAALNKASSVALSTIHGAKGRQSPFVILFDEFSASLQQERWIWFEPDAGVNVHGRRHEVVTSAGMMLMPQATLAAGEHLRQHAKDALNDEGLRLLYVALTRAQDGLVVVGEKKAQWHQLISAASMGAGS